MSELENDFKYAGSAFLVFGWQGRLNDSTLPEFLSLI